MTIPSFVIGIAGGTGAGKTTVTREIAAAVGDAVTRIPVDNYYEDLGHRPFEERANANYDHPSAFEWPLLTAQLDALLAGQAVEMPQYDFTEHVRRDETVTVEPTDVIVVEGILALYDDDVADMFDLRVYVETDADVRILRRIRRDVLERGRDLDGVLRTFGSDGLHESFALVNVIEQYLDTVKPMHDQFVEPTKKRADLIIPGGANDVAVTLLGEKVRAEAGEAVAELAADRNELERELDG